MNMTNNQSAALTPALRRTVTTLVAAGFAVTALAGCSPQEPPAQGGTQAPAASAEDAAANSETGLELSDGWAKAADSNMTSVFGALQNTGEHAVTLESISAPEIAGVAELHETVMNEQTGATQMQRVDGGFVVEPGATQTLEPGGDHIMLMELKCALKPGTDVTVELGFDNGHTQDITVPVRDFAGAQEHYAPGEEHEGHGEHEEHGEHSDMPTPESSDLPECHEH